MSSAPVFALADCNNFFVSCERLFEPTLKDRPVAVLSNNDGCIIARSNEVKALGIPMGAPLFKHRSVLEAHKTKLFSANFTLYGDISERVSVLLKEASPRVEVYSVDESFLQIEGLGITDYTAWARQLSAKVEKEVGIPISIGVAPTKTLAKLATEMVKKMPALQGGCSLAADEVITDEQQRYLQEQALKWQELSDVWGIGRRHTERLRRRGLRTAYDVAQMEDEWVLKHMTITGLRTVRELRGESCIPLGDFAANYQQKMVSSQRSFGRRIRGIAELEAAIASQCARAAMRLRRKDQLAWHGTVYLRAQLPDKSYQFISADFRLPEPTAFTGTIIKGAHYALRRIYDPDLRYEKGGVILVGLVDVSAQQMTLFGGPKQIRRMRKEDALMAAMDDLSLKYGKTTVLFASERASGGGWESKREQVSPAYTTQWHQLPMVRAR